MQSLIDPKQANAPQRYPTMYLAIEGVIGVGKTTLARLLQPAFEAELVLEVFEENPFLARFYEDRARYAFQTQIFFLLSRYHQQRRSVPDTLTPDQVLIADYTFEKDALFARLNLAEDERKMYDRVHAALAEKIARPGLVVYLRAGTDVLMQRIARRDRPYERAIQWEYIDQLNNAYERHFRHYHRGAPVLVVDTDELDYVRYPENLHWVENRIRQSLDFHPYQQELPLDINH